MKWSVDIIRITFNSKHFYLTPKTVFLSLKWNIPERDLGFVYNIQQCVWSNMSWPSDVLIPYVFYSNLHRTGSMLSWRRQHFTRHETIPSTLLPLKKGTMIIVICSVSSASFLAFCRTICFHIQYTSCTSHTVFISSYSCHTVMYSICIYILYSFIYCLYIFLFPTVHFFMLILFLVFLLFNLFNCDAFYKLTYL